MGANKSKDDSCKTDQSKFYELSLAERSEIIAHWPNLIAKNPDVIKNSWIKALERSPTILAVFGISDIRASGSSASLNRATTNVEAFFQEVIINLKLEQKAFSELCVELGAKHVPYVKTGLQTVHLDIFMV